MYKLSFYRHPKLDDQAVFWKVIRQSKDPAILPIGRCRNFNGVNDLLHDSKTNKKYLVTCVLDSCVFSSGMLSRLYVPELTYGKYKYYNIPF